MARPVGPLVVAKAIGDVLDVFIPVVEFTVHYGTKQVANGCEIKPSAAAKSPHLQLLSSNKPSAADHLYTLVMVDPDAPSPSEPIFREWIHWIVVDIPDGSDVTKGKEVVPYMGPQPPTGIHRYVFALFKQNGALMGRIRQQDVRANFSTRQFAAQNGLGSPVAALYFNSKKEPAARKR